MKVQFPNVGRLEYDEYWGERGVEILPKLREREEIMLAYIPAGSRVLDCGVGSSRLPVALKEKGCDVSVADISAPVLAAFKEKGIPGATIDLDRISDTPIEGQFDYIILSEVLEHTRNPEEVLKVLAPHTKHFALTIPNSAYYRFRLRLMFGGRAIKQWVVHPSEHLRFWSHSDFIDWLNALGFEVEFTKPSNGLWSQRFPWIKDLWPNLLGHQIVYICHAKQ